MEFNRFQATDHMTEYVVVSWFNFQGSDCVRGMSLDGQQTICLLVEDAIPLPPTPQEVAQALIDGRFREMAPNEEAGWAGACEGGRLWEHGGFTICASFEPGQGLRIDATCSVGDPDSWNDWSYDLRNDRLERV